MRVSGSARRSPSSIGAGRSDGPAAEQRLDPRDELAEVEGLDEVVVGAHLEAADPVLDVVERGEHEHREPRVAAAQLPADLVAVVTRQQHVEDHRVVVAGGGLVERVVAGVREIDREALASRVRAAIVCASFMSSSTTSKREAARIL